MSNDTKGLRLADDLLDGAAEIAEFVFGDREQTSVRRIFYMIAHGLLPATKRGRRIFGRRSEIDRALRGAGTGPEA